MKRRAFTLAELLVAVLVVAVVVPVTLQALAVAAQLDAGAAARETAGRLAETKLQELALTDAWRDSDSQGDFGDDHPGYTWELTTDEWSVAEVTMRHLTVAVRGPGRAGREPVTLSTLVEETEE